jgi:hypothetical protein
MEIRLTSPRNGRISGLSIHSPDGRKIADSGPFCMTHSISLAFPRHGSGVYCLTIRKDAQVIHRTLVAGID